MAIIINKSSMDTIFERLAKEASNGNKDSFKELYDYSGAGYADAQYYLAIYYKKNNDIDNYRYWIDKAASYGYEEAIKLNAKDNVHKEEIIRPDEKKGNRKSEGLLWIIGGVLLTIVSTAVSDGGFVLFYGAILYGLYLVLFK